MKQVQCKKCKSTDVLIYNRKTGMCEVCHRTKQHEDTLNRALSNLNSLWDDL